MRKEEGIESDDIWDDTELIKMYDEAVSATYKVELSANGSKLGVSSASNGWSVGDSCLARYNEDNLFYPAKVLEIRNEKSTRPEYLVLYEGYGDTDWVSSNDLLPATPCDDSQENGDVTMNSAVNESPTRMRIERTTKTTKGRPYRKNSEFSDRVSNRPHPTIPLLAPPPPSVHAGISVPDEGEALSSMLMSWYMSGYHTGYYQAIKDVNSNR